ncbi:MAG TPA: hypothetical protein VFU31_00580 [Candidatus Binatia bacterium]|nr:hypothetical protein [Candidatus Binatia bacterium]
MTEFFTKPSSTVKSIAKVTGGGLTVAMVVFMYATFVSREEMQAEVARAAVLREEMRATQSKMWTRINELQMTVESQRATLDLLVRMRWLGGYNVPVTNMVQLP